MGIAAMLVAFEIRTFIFEPFNLPSGSMYSALHVGDYILISKLGYGNNDFFNIDVANTKSYRTINRGDVMVFIHPRTP